MSGRTRGTTQILAAQVACTVLNRQGEACGQPGEAGLPAGICSGHAVEIFRAVSRLVDAKRAEEATR
jgi:hypothetical protein